jgi:quercetin dioxygenase-like cupin family protein
MSQRYELTPHEAVTVRESTPEALVVEAEYGPGGTAPPKHFHPGQDESFEVLEGALSVRVDGAERDLRVGERIEIPRGAAHQMWNPNEATARVSWTTAPRGRTEQWFRELHELRASGRVGDDGMPGPLAFAVMLNEYGDVFRLAGPQPVLRGAFALLAPLGRARGYRPRFARPVAQ